MRILLLLVAVSLPVFSYTPIETEAAGPYTRYVWEYAQYLNFIIDKHGLFKGNTEEGEGCQVVITRNSHGFDSIITRSPDTGRRTTQEMRAMDWDFQVYTDNGDQYFGRFRLSNELKIKISRKDFAFKMTTTSYPRPEQKFKTAFAISRLDIEDSTDGIYYGYFSMVENAGSNQSKSITCFNLKPL